METLINLITALLPVMYGLAAVNYQVYFARRDPFAERTCTPFLLGTVLLHWVYILLRMIHYARPPIVGLAEAFGIIALAVACVYLYVEKVQRNKFTGAFILPLVLLFQLISAALTPRQAGPISELLQSSLFGVHAVIAILGYSAFAVAAVYGVMYLLLYRALKRKKFGLIFDRLPSLDTLANMAFWATFLGWIALTATIGIGVLMSIELVPGFYTDLKFITTVLVWLVYGAGIAARFALGWHGARSVYLSLVGFGFALITMVGSNYLWATFHTFKT